MSRHEKRTYQSETRKAQARETKARILNAARSLFREKGFESVTIEQLAQAASVSAPTIYALFQSKKGILRALMNEALPPEQYEILVRHAVQEKSPAVRLGFAAKIARQMYDAEKLQMDILRGASLFASELKELEQEREHRRYMRLEESLKRMANENVLAKGLTFSQAHDILWAFTGRDLYRLFVIERGWTSDEYEKWLAQLLVKTLLGERLINCNPFTLHFDR